MNGPGSSGSSGGSSNAGGVSSGSGGGSTGSGDSSASAGLASINNIGSTGSALAPGAALGPGAASMLSWTRPGDRAGAGAPLGSGQKPSSSARGCARVCASLLSYLCRPDTSLSSIRAAGRFASGI